MGFQGRRFACASLETFANTQVRQAGNRNSFNVHLCPVPLILQLCSVTLSLIVTAGGHSVSCTQMNAGMLYLVKPEETASGESFCCLGHHENIPDLVQLEDSMIQQEAELYSYLISWPAVAILHIELDNIRVSCITNLSMCQLSFQSVNICSNVQMFKC